MSEKYYILHCCVCQEYFVNNGRLHYIDGKIAERVQEGFSSSFCDVYCYEKQLAISGLSKTDQEELKQSFLEKTLEGKE